ncbi:pentatricopeptide repeat-containing protein [Prunus yedoensis var. nudiflora]|uniref:Pentatricopeptide repeat-containing protein n=1 Tax=Prunus yedoensis var. nudiflora TaxID=2094558 RepID=A0A314Y419_PRUYE|nr:pentatricopeptide repeat-containing protein [Prunus yedoensis var. nudiflora]
MLSLRTSRRFCHAAIAITSNGCPAAVSNHVFDTKPLEEPALVKLKAERDPEKLFHLFKANAHNTLVIENRFAFEDTVSRLAGARRFDYIEHLLEHQKTLPQGRREGFIMRIITLYGAIEAFLNEVPQKFDIEVDVFSVNILIKAFCEMGILVKAYRIMVQMEKLGIRPDVITYTTLMSAFYKENWCEIGNGLWNLMVLKRCLPNLATFNVRIQYLVNRRRAWEANKLIGLMQNVGITPDEVTYNLVIKGFFQAGGDFDLAYTMCKDCMQKNWYPNVDTIHTLLEGLKRGKQLGKAKAIMMLVRKRVPPFSSKQLGDLQTILSKS